MTFRIFHAEAGNGTFRPIFAAVFHGSDGFLSSAKATVETDFELYSQPENRAS
jgi:hypothetical protein